MRGTVFAIKLGTFWWHKINCG